MFRLFAIWGGGAGEIKGEIISPFRRRNQLVSPRTLGVLSTLGKNHDTTPPQALQEAHPLPGAAIGAGLVCVRVE